MDFLLAAGLSLLRSYNINHDEQYAEGKDKGTNGRYEIQPVPSHPVGIGEYPAWHTAQAG